MYIHPLICIFIYNIICNTIQETTGLTCGSTKDLPGRLQKITSITEQLRRELDRGKLRDTEATRMGICTGIEWDIQSINIIPFFLFKWEILYPKLIFIRNMMIN